MFDMFRVVVLCCNGNIRSFVTVGNSCNLEYINFDFFCRGHIVVATPGRLIDMFGRQHVAFDLSASVKALVFFLHIYLPCGVWLLLYYSNCFSIA